MTAALEVATRFKQMYESFSLEDGGHPTGGRVGEVPLAIQLRFSFKGQKHDGIDLCFLVDNSSSMAHPPGDGWTCPSALIAVIESLKGLQQSLSPADRVAVIAFNHEVTLIGDGLQAPDQLPILANQIPPPAGATDIGGAIEAGAKLLASRATARPGAIVLLTDGRAQVRTRHNQTREDIFRESADSAVSSMQYLQQAGLDFVPMGFGVDWDVELLNRLSSQVGQRGAEFINGEAKARVCFNRVVSQQHNSVATNVSIEGLLNTTHFDWKAIRSVLPHRTGFHPIKLLKSADIDGFKGMTWKHCIGNVQREKDAVYCFIIEARPIREHIAPGEYSIGRFWLTCEDQNACSPWSIQLHVLKEPILDRAVSSPQNPDPDVENDWRLSLIPDIQNQISQHIGRAEHDEAVRKWQMILKILGDVNCESELQAEQMAYADYCNAHKVDPLVEKKLNESRTSTVVSTRDVAARHALDGQKAKRERVDGGRITVTKDTQAVIDKLRSLPRRPRY